MQTRLVSYLLAAAVIAIPTDSVAQSYSCLPASTGNPSRTTLGPELGLIKLIEDTEIDSYSKRVAVRIKIRGANLAAISRDIKRATVKNKGYDVDIDQEMSDDVKPVAIPGKSTRIDLDLSRLSMAGSLAMVVIKLQNDDDRLSFMSDAAFPIMNGLLANTTLRVAKKDCEDWTNMTEAKRLAVRKIRFFVLPKSGAPEEPFNIGLLVREASPSTYVMPIWVDPKIKNTG